MPSPFAWYFNNPQDSDVEIVIRVEAGTSTAADVDSQEAARRAYEGRVADASRAAHAVFCERIAGAEADAIGKEAPAYAVADVANEAAGNTAAHMVASLATVETPLGECSEPGASIDNGAWPSPAENTSFVRKLHGHKVVVKSHSEFFRARLDGHWLNSGCGGVANSTSAAAGLVNDTRVAMGATGRAGASIGGTDCCSCQVPTVVISVVDEEAGTLAEHMVKYMYTQELDPEQSTTELLRLLQLADEYGVELLVSACARKLRHSGLASWTPAEKLLALQLPACILSSHPAKVMVDAVKEAEWKAIDRLLKDTSRDSTGKRPTEEQSYLNGIVECLMADFLALETVLNDKAKRAAYCNWPAAAVVHLLSRNELRAGSESVVLVAALCWLKGAKGQGASSKDRNAVMRAVRLPRLRPVFAELVIKAWRGGGTELRELVAGLLGSSSWEQEGGDVTGTNRHEPLGTTKVLGNS